jgi:hypothetical protein
MGFAVSDTQAKKPNLVWLIGLWFVAVLAGTVLLWQYKSTPGEAATPLPLWPTKSTLAFDAKKPTLVMLAHPYCPCTEASLTELQELQQAFKEQLKMYVLFVDEGDLAEPLEQTKNWQKATTIPGLIALSDKGGVEAKLFDGKTSGQVLVYDPKGQLLFSGGITGARGHEGGNPGLDRVFAVLRGEPAESSTSPVFGCALF